MPVVAINARSFTQILTGVQRYALEVSRRLQGQVDCIRPDKPLAGMRGHLWEQTYLPLVVGRRLLWSPCTTGPLAVARQVCTFHDVVPLEHPEWFTPRFAQWYAWLLPKLAQRVRHIVAVSEFTRGRIVELLGVSPERVTAIPNGVNACFFPRGADEVRAAIQALGWPEHYFLCLGVELRKNTIKLLEAWRRAQKRLPDEIQLVIAGAGTLPGVHVNMSTTLPPRTINAGYIEDKHMPAAYSGALCLVFPTLYEGFGLPALEAMACGSPVIVSNSTALPEVVGGAGLLVDPTDTDSIAEAMVSVASSASLRSEMASRGLARARRFSWDATADGISRLLEMY